MGAGDAPRSYAERLLLVRRLARGVDCCRPCWRPKLVALGAFGSRCRLSRFLRAARRVPRDAALQWLAGSPSDPS